jgi:curved DNA-binding protein CbpA
LDLLREKNNFTWYEVLGFESEPTSKDAREKYRELIKKYHPDKAEKQEKPLANKIAKILNIAKESIPAEKTLAPRKSSFADLD